MVNPESASTKSEGKKNPVNLIFGSHIETLLPFSTKHLAIAVSGGADSMALAWLSNTWRKGTGCQLTALTVDHGLREASGREASQVATWMKDWGIPHNILRWEGEKPSTRIQETARKERYDLLTGWCSINGVDALLVAHNLEDQVETFLMRLLRGSGVDGLAGMRGYTKFNGIPVLRPLLKVSKIELKKVLLDVGQEWVEDLSNEDERFTRVRLRHCSNKLESLGLDADRLSQLTSKFGVLRSRLEEVTSDAVRNLVYFDSGGWAEVPRNILIESPEILSRRMFLSVLRSVSGRYHGPRSDRALRALKRIRTPKPFKAFSLGGCVIRDKGHNILVYREERREAKLIELEENAYCIWRDRILCEFGGQMLAAKSPYTLGPLTEAGWCSILQWNSNIRNLGVSLECAATLPALYDRDGLLEVPRFGLRRPHEHNAVSKRPPNEFGFTNVRFIWDIF